MVVKRLNGATGARRVGRWTIAEVLVVVGHGKTRLGLCRSLSSNATVPTVRVALLLRALTPKVVLTRMRSVRVLKAGTEAPDRWLRASCDRRVAPPMRTERVCRCDVPPEFVAQWRAGYRLLSWGSRPGGYDTQAFAH